MKFSPGGSTAWNPLAPHALVSGLETVCRTFGPSRMPIASLKHQRQRSLPLAAALGSFTLPTRCPSAPPLSPPACSSLPSLAAH